LRSISSDDVREDKAMIKLQLWQASVKSATTTKGFSIVTERGAPAAKVEEIALAVSEDMGINRYVSSIIRTCTVYAKG